MNERGRIDEKSLGSVRMLYFFGVGFFIIGCWYVWVYG